MRLNFLQAAALAAWTLASGASAAELGATDDLRCMAVGLALAGNANPEVKNAGTLASMYYLGRLDAHTPSVDLEAGLKQELMRMSPQDLKTEAARCGEELKARGKAVTEIGQRLQAAAAGAKTP
jgi:hypothetical protein